MLVLFEPRDSGEGEYNYGEEDMMTLDERAERALNEIMEWIITFDDDRNGTGLRAMRAVLKEAFPELFAITSTHKIVPLEPTPNMLRAATKAGAFATDEYRAMIEAAP